MMAQITFACVALCLAFLVAGCRTQEDSTRIAGVQPHVSEHGSIPVHEGKDFLEDIAPRELDTYTMITIKPDPHIDYKILQAPRDRSVEYKIIEKNPTQAGKIKSKTKECLPRDD
jgi:hypothetical protein